MWITRLIDWVKLIPSVHSVRCHRWYSMNYVWNTVILKLITPHCAIPCYLFLHLRYSNYKYVTNYTYISINVIFHKNTIYNYLSLHLQVQLPGKSLTTKKKHRNFFDSSSLRLFGTSWLGVLNKPPSHSRRRTTFSCAARKPFFLGKLQWCSLGRFKSYLWSKCQWRKMTKPHQNAK